MESGLNLFSIRTLISSDDDFINTSKKLKEMGYKYLQYSGRTFDAEIIKKELKEVGLPVILTHVPMERILNDTDKLMEEHRSINCFNIGLGMMPTSIISDENKCLETINRLNEIGKKMSENGFKFFYHFHHFEFIKLSSGERIIDYMINNCKYINFTADTYWIQYGGGNVLEYLNKMSGRIECIHLKDYKINNSDGDSFVPRFAPIGDGNINFKPIVELCKNLGVKYYLVEQDNAVDFNPLEQVKKSVEEIKTWQ